MTIRSFLSAGRWRTVLVLLLVPALVAGGVLWGTWHSDARLRQVQAAVVNNDEMVEIDGQPTPLGRQLAAEIVDSDRAQNVTWVLADTEHARAGLATGEYAAVVTIPEEFSAAATSFAKPVDEAVQATITVDTSPVATLSETAVGQAVAYAAVNALNNVLTREYLTNVYLGFGEQRTQMLELADGTRQLADGAAQLADGTDASADGARQLADGMSLSADGAAQLAAGLEQASAASGALRDGAGQSAAGAAQLATGAGTLADGTQTWAAGARAYADGVGQYTGGVASLSDGLATYADGVDTYADGVAAYAGGINQVLSPARSALQALPEWGGWLTAADAWVARAPQEAAALTGPLTDLISQTRAFVQRVAGLAEQGDGVADALTAARGAADGLANGGVTCPTELDADACAAYTAGAIAAAEQVRDGLAEVDDADLAEGLDGLAALAPQILAALDEAQTAVDGLTGWAGELQASYAEVKAALPAGTPLTKDDTLAVLDQLVSAGDQLTWGGQQLAGGAGQLADGADALAGSGAALAGGAGDLAGGATQLADGAGSLAGGTRQVASGLGQLAGGVNAYTGGVDAAASGAGELSSGLGRLDEGSQQLAGGLDALAEGGQQLADGTDELATGVAAGIDQIPSYTDDEAATMASVVAAPVDADPLAGLARPGLAYASLLLVLALWLGAMATFAALPALTPRALTSRASDLRLLAGSLVPGAAVVAVQALLLGAVGAVVLRLPLGASAALVGVLLVAGAAFALVNHALASLLGNVGRLIGLALALVTLVVASTAAPGVLDAAAVLSPLTPALDAVRSVGVGTSPVIAAMTLLGWAAVAFVGSLAAVHRTRTVPLAALAA